MWTSIVFGWGIGLAILGAVLMALVICLRNRNIKVSWYEWLLGGVGLLLMLYAIQNFYGCFLESEIQAGWMCLIVFGIPALLLLAIPSLQIWRRSRAT